MDGLEKHMFELLQKVTVLTEQVKNQNVTIEKMVQNLEVSIERIELLEKESYAKKVKHKTYSNQFEFLKANWLLISGFIAFIGVTFTSIDLALKLPSKEQIYVVKNEKSQK